MLESSGSPVVQRLCNTLVLWLTSFISSRLEMTVGHEPSVAYLFKAADGKKAHESELQADLINQLRPFLLGTEIEVSDIGGGRADVFVPLRAEHLVIEVKREEVAAFFVGNKKTPAGLVIPRSICVQSSDAHHHDHISQRNRHTWIQIEEASFSEVKAALEFPHRVKLTKPSEAQSKIIGLHIVGQFLTEQWIRLNPGINAFIGCKGSGKTSVLECIRFVMNTAVPEERKESVNKHLQHILGPSGFVECLIQQNDGTKVLFTRRSDSPDRILMTKEDGTSEEISKSQGRLADINILGWHEIEAVADHPQARTRLIDQTNDYESIRSLYESTSSHVEEARNTMPLLQAAIRRFKRAKATYQDVKRKRETLKKLEQADLFAIQQKYERLVGLIGQLEALKGQLGEAATSMDDIRKTRLSGQMSIPNCAIE